MDYSISQDSPLSLGMGRIFDQWEDFNGLTDDLRIFSTEIDSASAIIFIIGNGDFAGTTNNFSRHVVKVWKD